MAKVDDDVMIKLMVIMLDVCIEVMTTTIQSQVMLVFVVWKLNKTAMCAKNQLKLMRTDATL